ncbi:MAG: hypothetical protein K0S55_747 [Clostridia bacterium]|nr:hypothetical protein [Clostridia bacterium]
MVYRIVCKFANTEGAQAAARRINEKIPDIYEIRLRYHSQFLDNGVTNNVIYAHTSNAVFPYSMSPDDPPMLNWESSVLGIPQMEVSDECYLTLLLEEEKVTDAHQIIFNEGGYDVKSYSSKLF